ncbi:MAG: hypothetical protein HYX80_10215 [Chloroflexi bacterium]|nr:hypothetical protein [Chloroflexota bacterium]
MKRLLFLIALALLVTGVIIFSSTGNETKEPVDKGIEIRLAPIEEVRVRMGETFPPLVIVYVRAGLVDGCATPHEIKTERSLNTINIKVTTQRPREAICTQVYSTFERNIPLGSNFTPGTTYTVNVNDAKQVSFTAR